MTLNLKCFNIASIQHAHWGITAFFENGIVNGRNLHLLEWSDVLRTYNSNQNFESSFNPKSSKCSVLLWDFVLLTRTLKVLCIKCSNKKIIYIYIYIYFLMYINISKFGDTEILLLKKPWVECTCKSACTTLWLFPVLRNHFIS